MKIIIKQTNLNLVYPRIIEYRKKFANFEDVLQQYFMPSTILPIPEQVQDEVPRIIAQTKMTFYIKYSFICFIFHYKL